MATSVDTNVLSYLLLNDDESLADAAERALQEAAAGGILLVCGPVFAELLAVGTWDASELASALSEVGIEIDDRWDRDVWAEAAAGFARYLRTRRPAEYVCPNCGTRQRFRCRTCRAELGRPRHVLADFLIGGHAARYGCALLTNDVGLYQSFFPQLHLVTLASSAADEDLQDPETAD